MQCHVVNTQQMQYVSLHIQGPTYTQSTAYSAHSTHRLCVHGILVMYLCGLCLHIIIITKESPCMIYNTLTLVELVVRNISPLDSIYWYLYRRA